ncbi:MAG TPA: 3-methyl-2-oxobutanoate dehydrogenase subunit VorB [Anaerohalosphaeraceae bacterium]|nr:3-methyl-2-oxobutanoate dehydrogenase subunit VorB [Anaerohalosphaeraceae bacterium]
MAEKVLFKGNELLVEAAIEAGCRFYAGYPITPQNEVPERMSWRMPQAGGVFIQAESEIAAINMIFGASAAGARCMTSSSSPGISLKQEGISYIAAAELPCVIVNMQRGGPGLGNIRAAQGDYFQAVKGGGHGDYRLIVLTPATLQELYDLTLNAFDYADYYRNPVMILGDGILGQMAEPAEKHPYHPILDLPPKDYILDGCKGRNSRVVRTLFLHPADGLMKHNLHLQEKYARIQRELSLVEQYQTDDAEVIIAAYGISGRAAKGAVKAARREGIKAGLIRPLCVWPFPSDVYRRAAERAKSFLVVEMSHGQFVEDVKLAIECRRPVAFLGKGGGWYPSQDEIVEQIRRLANEKSKPTTARGKR